MSKQKESARYVIFAISWACVLFILALTLPFVTARNSNKVITSVALDGNAPLFWILGLIVVSVLVGFLLRYGDRTGDRLVVSLAWLFSGFIFVIGIIGFLTLLFIAGLAIALVGASLLKACSLIATFRTKRN